MEVLSQTGQRRLQNIVADRRLRMAGHIIRMPPGRPANHAMSWTPRGSSRRRGRPTKIWWSTFKEDLVDRGVDRSSVRAVATNKSRWQTLAAHCPVNDRRIQVLSAKFMYATCCRFTTTGWSKNGYTVLFLG